MWTQPVLTESYPAAAATVPAARARITEFAAARGSSGDRLEEIRLAASEALTNAVVHAYPPGQTGQLHVTAAVAEGDLWVLVADDGQGLHARSARAGLGLGLALIAQLCEEFAIVRRASGGTELRMRFTLDREPPPPKPVSRGLGSRNTRGTARAPASGA